MEIQDEGLLIVMQSAVAIGKMDQRIIIEVDTPGRGPTGSETPSWATLATVWANVEYLSGGEEYEGQQVFAEAKAAFSIRHRTDVSPKTNRVNFDSKLWDIDRVEPVNRKRRLKIYATARAE